MKEIIQGLARCNSKFAPPWAKFTRKFAPLRKYFIYSIYMDINNVNAGKVYLILYVYICMNSTVPNSDVRT